MSKYDGNEFRSLREWILNEEKNGKSTWDDLDLLVEDKFEMLKDDDLIAPNDMEYGEWHDFVQYMRDDDAVPFEEVKISGISSGEDAVENFPEISETDSAWADYKGLLLGTGTSGKGLSKRSVEGIESNCRWILGHLERVNDPADSVKGLVMGSVQSGKTANMIGLVSMAADNDWNIFIVLSGSLENLRRQTLGRFKNDLSGCGGYSWHFLDYGQDPLHMKDVDDDEKEYSADRLNLNTYPCASLNDARLDRYVIVCLKNSRRLQNLIKWLHSDSNSSHRMRIVVIDDEADQASINTRGMRDDEVVTRTRINGLIVNLVNGRDVDGNESEASFQAMNYIAYTATPYANILNEAVEESLYPGDFICSLPESDEYFGAKAIFGSKSDENYKGLNIIRTVPRNEVEMFRQIRGRAGHDQNQNEAMVLLPGEMKKSICWFLYAAAVIRLSGMKKPVSMLIHTAARQDEHFLEKEAIKSWFRDETDSVLELCGIVYEEEKGSFTLNDLEDAYHGYAVKDTEILHNFPDFGDIREDIETMVRNVKPIGMVEDGELEYDERAVHLCVDNSRADRIDDDGTHLRIAYPSKERLNSMNKAPVFIVIGGNTLSRGLTLDGLVCTYFARNVNQADTLMQMARWFGYRRGYELLQRVWLPESVQTKFEVMEEIDERLKRELEDFKTKDKRPIEFGPRIMTSSKIAGFMLTGRNRAQNMVPCKFDFTGDSYETTKFKDSEELLENNIAVTEGFLAGIGRLPERSDIVTSAFVWRDVDWEYIRMNFLGEGGYEIPDSFPLHADMDYLITWMEQMCEEDRFTQWDVAVAGSERARDRWTIPNTGYDVGKIERSKKKSREYIDIGSLRSGSDILCDVCKDGLTTEQKNDLEKGIENKKNLIALRSELGLSDRPLLLLYRIDKNGGREAQYRESIGSCVDIIGFSIVIAGQENEEGYVREVQVRLPDWDDDGDDE